MKLPGPVVLGINSILAKENIKVKQNGEHLNTSAIVKLLKNIEEEANHEKEEQDELSKFLRKAYINETKTIISDSDVFCNAKSKKRWKNIVLNPSFKRVSGPCPDFDNLIDQPKYSSARLGIADTRLIKKYLCKEPLRIAVTPFMPGALALFHYLKNTKGYNIEIISNYAHGAEIAQRIVDNNLYEAVDLAVVGAAPGANLIANQRKHEFTPFFLLPKLSQKILAKRKKAKQAKLNSGRFLFVNEIPSNPAFLFDELVHKNLIKRNQIDTLHSDPDQTMHAFKTNEDLKAIAFFPNYLLLKKFTDASIVNTKEANQFAECVMFVKDSIRKDSPKLQAISLALRNAWFELKTDSSRIEQTFAPYFSDSDNISRIKRFSGLT